MNDIARQLIQSYGRMLSGCFHYGVAHYFSKHADELNRISNRAKACVISDYIYTEIKRNLEGKQGFQFIEDGSRRFIGYSSRFLIKIKKLNRNLKASFTNTDSALRFQYQLDLGLMPAATNVYMGYVVNKIDGEIERIALVCPSRTGGIGWHVDLDSVQTQIELVEYSNQHEILPVKRIRAKSTGRMRKASNGEKIQS